MLFGGFHPSSVVFVHRFWYFGIDILKIFSNKFMLSLPTSDKRLKHLPLTVTFEILSKCRF